MPTRLLLVALSGVRVHDPELLALGLSLPGFVDRGRVIAALPSLGLLTLAALAAEDWEVDYVEVDRLDEESLQELLARPADLVAVSSLTARILDAYRIADVLRAAGQVVVLGGLHVSAEPDEAARHADSIVVGEGEPVFRRLLDDYSADRLLPRYDARATPHDLGALTAADPLPRWDLLDLQAYNRVPLQTTRGCPLACSFCGASRLISTYKRKSIPRLRAELGAITARWSKPFVELADDNTFVHRGWSYELLELLAEHDLHWFTETDLSIADDPQLLRALADAGCAQVLVGLESLDARALDGMEPTGHKRRWGHDVLDRIAAIQDHGIPVNGCFVFGFDGQGPAAFEEVDAFVDEAGLCEVQITLLTPFPGTALRRSLAAEGRLLPDRGWNHYTLFDPTFEPRGMSLPELTGGFRELMTSLYAPARVERRRALTTTCYRRRP